MNQETYDNLQEASVSDLAQRLKEAAQTKASAPDPRRVIAEQLAKLEKAEQVYKLTDDEERMLKAYRRTCATTPAPHTFSWHIPHPKSGEIVKPPDVALILDPHQG